MCNNKKLKQSLLFILHIPPPVNGAAMVGKFIKESQAINQAFNSDYINLTTSFTLNKIGKGGISKLFTLLRIQSRVIKALFYNKYDLCYMSLTAKGAGFYKDLFVVAILKLFKKKIIYHLHNKGIAYNSKNRLNKYLYRFAFKNTKTILLSSYLYYDVMNYVSVKDVYFCSNGIPKSENFSLLKTKEPNTRQVCRLLFLSNIIIEKGVLVLLDACKILKEKKINFECHFVGSWSDITEDQFKDIVLNYKISDNVFAHGKKYSDEKIEYFLQSDIFVFPTYYHNECFPLVLLEAMEHGLALVSTPEGGIPEIIIHGQTGFLVPQKNAEELANKLEILIKDSELCARMGKNGKKRFEELYTLDKFEHHLVEILRSAADYKK